MSDDKIPSTIKISVGIIGAILCMGLKWQ